MTSASSPKSVSIVIGSRGSDLALAQSRWIGERLRAHGVESRIEVIKTQGDKIQDVPLAQIDGKGFFTKELEEALLAGRVDLAVHSLKDLPTVSPPGLAVTAIPGREDARDCLVVNPKVYDPDASKLPLVTGARVGTSSIRRQTQLRSLRPDLGLADLRGNVPTRVEKLRSSEELDAIVLAYAGLRRLNLALGDLRLSLLSPEVFVPAPAQGALGLQTRDEDSDVVDSVRRLEDPDDARRVAAERRLLARLEGGCHLPLGAHAVSVGTSIELSAFLGATEKWGEERRVRVLRSSPEEAAEAAFLALTSAISS